jgi:hypothetical protein
MLSPAQSREHASHDKARRASAASFVLSILFSSRPEGNRSKPVDQTPMSAAKGLGAAAAAAPLLARRQGDGSFAKERVRRLARFKFLLGTAFGPSGHTAERKAERRQIKDRSRYGPAGDAAISLRSSSAGNTLSGHRPHVGADGGGTLMTAITLRRSYFATRAMLGLRNHKVRIPLTFVRFRARSQQTREA